MSDIVEQARKAASQGDFYLHNSLVYKLIDEVERLRAELNACGLDCEAYFNRSEYCIETERQLRAEIERLQAALLVIANHSGIHSDFPHSAENLQRYARTALRGGK